MRRWTAVACGGAMLAAGYVAGRWDALSPATVRAQDGQSLVSAETTDKIKIADRYLRDAIDAMKVEGKYEVVTEGTNPFLVFSGGGNAREDLESGAGVDPFTFAALYAGQATADIAPQLAYDEKHRLTYNGQVVRMYSRARLQQSFANRAAVTQGPAPATEPAP